MSYGVLCYADSLTRDQLVDFARNTEAAGVDTVWRPELMGREPFVTCATVLGATSTLRVGTAIANVYARDAVATKAAAYSLADGYGDRFDLGLGLSNKVINGPRDYHRAWRARGFVDGDFIDGGSDDFIDAIMPIMLDLNADAGWQEIAKLVG